MVRSDGGSSDPVDPLVGYSSLSLFPLSFNPRVSAVDDPNPNFPTINSLHSHLKAMVIRSPEKLLTQAKTILDDSLDLLKADKASAMASKDNIEAGFAANEKHPQEKRPALGLKRAKFSAKPMPRQPAVMLEPSIDIDKLDDPEEFFAAFDRMENAKKELQKLKGQPLTELDQNLSSLHPRGRRPSLFGKSATYKHHTYTSTAPDDNSMTLLSSQETLVSPIRQDVLSETNVVNVSPNARVVDSASTKIKKANELDELLSCDYEGLDEAGVVNLLQDKLDIKLRVIGRTSLLDLHDVPPRKFVSSSDALPKVKDTASRLTGMTKAAGKPLVVSSQLRETSVQLQVSPGLSKSPLASISLLNRHISKFSPSKDPFSALDIESSPVRSSPETQHGKQSDLGDARMDLYNSWRSLVRGEESNSVASPIVAMNVEANGIASSSQPKGPLDGVSQFDQAGTRNDLHEFGKSTAHGEESTAVCGRDPPFLVVNDVTPTSEPKEFADGVSQSDQVEITEGLCDHMRSPAHRDNRVADPCEDSLVFAERDVDPTSEDKELEDEMAQAGDSVRQKHSDVGSDMERSIASGVERCGVGADLNAEDGCTDGLTKETRGSTKRKLDGRKKAKAPSQVDSSKEATKKGRKANTLSNTPVPKETENKRRKVDPAPGPSKRKEMRRHSLFDAGTKWEAGVRRSNRIRMRPLEYWKGERFLYGRVHNSLVTVIGVKYASPSKEAEQPAAKVKSFVSDDYKDLVDLAALH